MIIIALFNHQKSAIKFNEKKLFGNYARFYEYKNLAEGCHIMQITIPKYITLCHEN